MTPAEPFDADAFKAAQRADWQVAAPGWRRWYDVLEAGGEVVTRVLVEQTRIGPGDAVLDVATGYGEPALTASPEDFTQWTKDVAPPIANLLMGQPPAVQEQVWQRVTEAWTPLTTPEGRVRTENQAIWVAATK